MTVSSFYAVPREVIALAYIRLSNDNDGRMQSPETQWDKIVWLSKTFNVPLPPPERVFIDRNLSASDPKVVRFDYERMLKTIREIDPTRYEVVILAYLRDRLFRQPKEWQEFIELLGKRNYCGRLIDGNGIADLSYASGYETVAAYGEAQKTAERTRDNISTSAHKGKGHGPAPYGWTREYDHSGVGKPISTTVVVEAQADVIREAADRVLAGEHLRAICRDFDARGIAPPGAGKVYRRDRVTREPTRWAGDTWTLQTLRKLLLRPANIGIREYTTTHGGRRSAPEAIKGDWDAILDDGVYRRLCAKLTDPARLTTTSNTGKYLLTGISTCGAILIGDEGREYVCGLPVTGQLTSSRKGGGRREAAGYRCPKGHVYRSMVRTDAVVVTEVLHVLSQPEVRAGLTAPPDAEASAALEREAALLARRSEVEHCAASGLLDLATLARVAADIDRQLAAARAIVTRTQDVEVYSDLLRADPVDIESMWETLTLDRRRSILRALFTVEILRTPNPGAKTFDPTMVVVTLRPMKA